MKGRIHGYLTKEGGGPSPITLGNWIAGFTGIKLMEIKFATGFPGIVVGIKCSAYQESWCLEGS